MICDLNEDRLVAAHEELSAFGLVRSEVVDVTSREAVEYLVGQAKGAFGWIDVLANNAGISRFEPFLEITGRNLERHPGDQLDRRLPVLAGRGSSDEEFGVRRDGLIWARPTASWERKGWPTTTPPRQGSSLLDQDDGHRAGTSQHQGQLRLPPASS